MDKQKIIALTGSDESFPGIIRSSLEQDRPLLANLNLVHNISYDISDFFKKYKRLPENPFELVMFVNERYARDPEEYLFKRVAKGKTNLILSVPSDIIYSFMHQNEVGDRYYLLRSEKEGLVMNFLYVRILSDLVSHDPNEIFRFIKSGKFASF